MNCGPVAQNKPRGTHHPKVLSLGYRTHRLRPLLIEYCRRPNDRTHRDSILIHDSIFFCLALCPNLPMASDGQRHRRFSGLFRQNVSYMSPVGVACLGLGLGPVDGDNGALHLPAICPILATSAFHQFQAVLQFFLGTRAHLKNQEHHITCPDRFGRIYVRLVANRVGLDEYTVGAGWQ